MLSGTLGNFNRFPVAILGLPSLPFADVLAAAFLTAVSSASLLVVLQRQWEGDASFALLDCEAAIAIDPHLSRAYLIRTQALLALRRFLLASQAAKELEARFPEQVSYAALSEGGGQQRASEHTVFAAFRSGCRCCPPGAGPAVGLPETVVSMWCQKNGLGYVDVIRSSFREPVLEGLGRVRQPLGFH